VVIAKAEPTVTCSARYMYLRQARCKLGQRLHVYNGFTAQGRTDFVSLITTDLPVGRRTVCSMADQGRDEEERRQLAIISRLNGLQQF